MAREVKDITSRKQWDIFVESHPEANFLQAWQWGEFHKSLGHDVVRRGLFDGKKLIGVYEGYVEPAKRGRHPAAAAQDTAPRPAAASLAKD